MALVAVPGFQPHITIPVQIANLRSRPTSLLYHFQLRVFPVPLCLISCPISSPFSFQLFSFFFISSPLSSPASKLFFGSFSSPLSFQSSVSFLSHFQLGFFPVPPQLHFLSQFQTNIFPVLLQLHFCPVSRPVSFQSYFSFIFVHYHPNFFPVSLLLYFLSHFQL